MSESFPSNFEPDEEIPLTDGHLQDKFYHSDTADTGHDPIMARDSIDPPVDSEPVQDSEDQDPKLSFEELPEEVQRRVLESRQRPKRNLYDKQAPIYFERRGYK